MTDEKVECSGDVVGHPDHYNWHPAVECIAVTQHFSFSLGNAIKYIWRAGRKSEDAITDLRKARQYLDFEIARLSGNEDVIAVEPLSAERPIKPSWETRSDGFFQATPTANAVWLDAFKSGVRGWVGPNRCGHAASDKERALGYTGETSHQPHKYGHHGYGWCDGFI